MHAMVAQSQWHRPQRRGSVQRPTARYTFVHRGIITAVDRAATCGCGSPVMKKANAMINLAMLSFWHVHAGDYARQADEHPDTQLVAVWDENAERGRAEAAKRNLTFYESLDELLAREEVHGVINDTPTTMHLSVLTAAARAGKHIFTEKVVAATQREDDLINRAVQQAGVALTVSLPRVYWGITQAIHDVVASGALGTLTYARVRVSHDGALATARHANGWLPAHFYDLGETAGGAMIDLGCHPMYLTRMLLGMPETVQSTFGYFTGRDVEDNAVVTLGYTNGAIGVVETGFVAPGDRGTVELHGTDGSLLLSGPEQKLTYRSRKTTDGAWMTVDAIPADASPAFSQWVEHIKLGTRADANVALASELSALMEAANLAAKTGQTVRVETLVRA